MNLSWFGDWRFDPRRQAAFHELVALQAQPPPKARL